MLIKCGFIAGDVSGSHLKLRRVKHGGRRATLMVTRCYFNYFDRSDD